MTQVLIVGCGDLGGEVANQLTQLGIKTMGARRNASSLNDSNVIQIDVTQPDSLESLQYIQPQILIYCVAANGQTDEQYKAHYVDGLKNVLATQVANTKLQHVFFVSSTRVYGQITNVLLDESVEAIPADFGGERLLEAENLLKTLSCGATVLRLSGIYGMNRLRMINLAKLPKSWPSQNSWSNRIHRDDAAAFIVFLVRQVFAVHQIQDCYIVTDSAPASQHEVLTWIANQMKQILPQQALEPVSGGKRLSNQRLLATGFRLQYPDFKVGYQSILSSIQ